MRCALRLVLVGLLTTSALASASAQNGIPWLSDLGQAQQAAQQTRRLLLVHFYSDNCPPCRRLDQVVFTNPDVSRAISLNYVPVKINGQQAREVAFQYQVDRWPTDVILGPQGQVLYKTVSPQDPTRYIQLLNAVAADSHVGSPPIQTVSHGRAQPQAAGAHVALTYDGVATAANGAAYAELAPARQPPTAAAQAYPPQAPAPPGAGTRSPSYARSAEQAASYASGYAPPPEPNVPQGSGYDPRSSWAPPAPAGGPAPQMSANDYGVRDDRTPPPTPAPVVTDARASSPLADSDRGPRRSTWQDNPFVTDRREPDRSNRTATDDADPPTGAGPPALDGYCPVTLQEQERWAKGDPRWGATHRGQTYLFLSQQHQQRFLADPDRYSPVLSGLDPIRYVDRGELVPGDRTHGMWFRGKIYLFADETSLDRFSRSPDAYAQRTHEIMMGLGR